MKMVGPIKKNFGNTLFYGVRDTEYYLINYLVVNIVKTFNKM